MADKVTPTCLVLHTDYHYPYDFVSGNIGTEDVYIFIAMFCDYCFLSVFDTSINFMRCFPLIIIKKKKRKKEKKKKTRKENAESMDRSCKFEGVVTQKLDGT